MASTTSSPASNVSLVRGLGLFAAIAVVVGDVIGTGVFLKARVMTCNVGTPGLVVTVWVVGGLLSLAGALTYAELAARMPRAGGEYVFIREAYGRLWGFLYGWTRFFVASTGGLAGLAAGFAIFLNIVSEGALGRFAVTLPGSQMSIGALPLVASAAIAIVTLVNCAAVSVGGRIASVLATLKVALVLGVGIGAFALARGDWAHYAMSGAAGACEGVAAAARGGFAGFGAAMLGAMWAYNGWNEVTYVAGEVKDPQRNLPLAIVGGIGIIATLYVFANVAYFYVLAPAAVAGIPASSAVATQVVSTFLGPAAAGVMAGALAMSVFGSLQIVSLVSARIPYAMATDGVFFPFMARLSPRTCVPIRALVAQAAWGIVLVFSGSYDTITDYAIFAVLMFVILATASIFVFRRRPQEGDPGYRMWGYPVVPILFLMVAGWLVVNTVVTTPGRALAGVGFMLIGLPFYWYWTRGKRPATAVASR
ncbi:MAG TPA: amino acid permease [Vicinamibacterales bacterium]|nr:amino acid permease [Vicinamibacterales bacterium]